MIKSTFDPKEYQKTPYYKFMHQRKEAVHQRNIEWNLTFEEWWNIWQNSGHWEERGSLGYHMCRKGDEGPYSVDNVYIAHHTQNKKDQQLNGKGSKPPINRKITEKQKEEIREELKNYTIGLVGKIAEKYNLSKQYIYSIIYGYN